MSGLGRAEQVSQPARDAFRTLIARLLQPGAQPDAETLERAGADAAPGAMAELEAADWLARDAAGMLAAIYPFALTATGIAVAVAGVERQAMCAIDALGVAPMLDQRATVTATCVECGRALRIEVGPDGIRSRRPRDIVVVRRLARGPAHLSRCAATRFTCSPMHAEAWLRKQGGPDDVLQSLETAFIEARAIFGGLYRN